MRLIGASVVRNLLPVLIAFSVSACNPRSIAVPPVIPTSATPTEPAATARATVQPAVTETNRPYLIAYTFWPDGGDELYGCLRGMSQPSIILYADGEFIILRDRYERTILTRSETELLMQQIVDTGLLDQPEDSYAEGFNELVVRGQRFHSGYSDDLTDPFWHAIDILDRFNAGNFQPYVPDQLSLVIYGVASVESIEYLFAASTPATSDWTNSPLNRFGVGWHEIRGAEVGEVLDQFTGFPDIRVFSAGDKTYVALTCSNVAWPY